MDIKTQLIEELAIELAVTLELWEDEPDAWMPESLELIDKAVAYLTQMDIPIPEPVAYIQRRRLDRAA